MLTILKCQLQWTLEVQDIPVPGCVKLLGVQVQNETTPVAWFEIDTERRYDKCRVLFQFQWTGRELSALARAGAIDYITTLQHGGLVWHVYAAHPVYSAYSLKDEE